MKVTKVAKNQILLEDESFKNLKDSDLNNVKSKTGLSDSEFDDEYSGMIFGYREPGMDASKQIFMGNKVSVYTLICSMLENLVREKIMSEETLDEMIRLVHIGLQKHK